MTDSSPVIAHVNLAHGFRGGERQTELLIAELASRGLRQILVCREDSPLLDHLKTAPGVEFIRLKNKPDARLFGHSALGHRPVIVQAHEARAAQWACLQHLLYKVPYVITRRVPEPIRDNFVNRAINTKAAALVAISSAIADNLRKQFAREPVIIPSVNAGMQVDTENAARLQQQYAGKFVIGQIGALVDRHKGQSVTLQAAALLQAHIPNLQLVFLGDGEDKEKLQQQAKELGVAADFPGFVSCVADYLTCFDVFAFPSWYEGLGSVLLDVMAQRVPVVASRTGGIPDVVKDGQSGLLIEPGDSKALCAHILELKDNSELRERVIAGGLDMVRSHSPQAMADSYLALYTRLTGVNFPHTV